MRHAVQIVPTDALADPRLIVDLARAAETARWDGVFLDDRTPRDAPSAEPWTVLSGIATVTTRLVLGAAVTPLPRRPAHLVAHALATLDHLSQGRVVLAAGMGGNREMHALGVARDSRVRAAMLDESLEVIAQLWSGEVVTTGGPHVVLHGAGVPVPVQRPRIPIWIGGWTRDAMRRAARWDGFVISGVGKDGRPLRSPEQVAEMVDIVEGARKSDEPLEVALCGTSNRRDASGPSSFEAAGATWWLEVLDPSQSSVDALAERVEAGPAVPARRTRPK